MKDPSVGRATPRRPSVLRDAWAFLRIRKKWWLLPILIALVLLGILLLVGQSSAVGPFVYTLF